VVDPKDGGVSRGVTREAGPDSESGTVGRLPEAPPCPFCDGGETEIMNPFGSHASVATYWCRTCRSPFEMLKWR
jgi:hypothetical protein